MQLHQLNHMQITCTLLKTDNQTDTSSPIKIFTGRNNHLPVIVASDTP